MIDITESARAQQRARHDAIRAAVYVEEAEAGEAEAVETTNTLDVQMHLRIDRDLDAQLRKQASEEGIPTSALARRLLRQPLQQSSGIMSQAGVEDLARRVAREELRTHWETGSSGDMNSSNRRSAFGDGDDSAAMESVRGAVAARRSSCGASLA